MHTRCINIMLKHRQSVVGKRYIYKCYFRIFLHGKCIYLTASLKIYRMKYLTVSCFLLVLAITAFAEDKVDKVDEYFRDCFAGHELSSENVTDWYESELVPESEKKEFGCIVICTINKLDITEGDTIDMDKLYAFLEKRHPGKDKKTVEEMLDRVTPCIKAAEEINDYCERGVEYARCMREE